MDGGSDASRRDAAAEAALSSIYRESALEAPAPATDAAVCAAAREAASRRRFWHGLQGRPPGFGAFGARAGIALASVSVVAVLAAVTLRDTAGPPPDPRRPPASPGISAPARPEPAAPPTAPGIAQSEPAPASASGPAATLPRDEVHLATTPGGPPAAAGEAASADTAHAPPGTAATPPSARTVSEAMRAPARRAVILGDDPAAWLERIEALLEQGLQDEARAGFYAFRARFPRHPVPDDLLPRLGM